MSSRVWLLLALVFAAAPRAADAQAQPDCDVTMGDINFGVVNNIGQGDAYVSGPMRIECRQGYANTWALVCIALGAPGDTSWDPRTLTGPLGRRLEYNIYADASHSTIWGSAYSTAGKHVGVNVRLGTYGTGSSNVYYYAKLRGGQNDARAGDYSRYFSAANQDVAVRVLGHYGGSYTCTADMQIISRFSFMVRATVVPDCDIAATNLDFGSADAGLASIPRLATSTITATCTAGSNYSIALDRGRGTAATVAQRRVTRSGGIDTLRYRLYTNILRTQLWGDGSLGTSAASGTGQGVQQQTVHTVYGTLEAQQPGRAGDYTDTVTATITY